MATRYHTLTALYTETIKDLSSDVHTWLNFLRSAGRNYKLPFEDQVLIFAQRPDATAVLEIERWNKGFGRWVNKGACGIAVFGEPGSRVPKYYFDITDTHASRYARPVPLWDMDASYEAEVVDALGTAFGEADDELSAEQKIIEIAHIIATDNATDYLESLAACSAGSAFENFSAGLTAELFTDFLSDSIAASVLMRLGYRASEVNIADMAEYLELFNTVEAFNVAGCATSDCMEVALREVAMKIAELERSGIEDNRRLESFAKSPHNQGKNEERSTDGDNLRASGRTPAAESDSGKQDHAAGNVRDSEVELPEAPQTGNVSESDDSRQARRPFGGDRDPGNRDDGADYQSDDGEPEHHREPEATRTDALGGTREQHPSERTGAGDERTNTELEPLPSEQEQTDLINGAGEKRSPAPTVLRGETPSISLGTKVFIGDREYEFLGVENGIVSLFDDKSPLFPKELDVAEFAQKLEENPLNAHLENAVIASKPETAPTPVNPPTPTPQTPKALSEEQSLGPALRNFTITDNALGEGTPKERLGWNIEAIRTLKLIESEERRATPAEQEVLSRYVGFGSLPQAFDESAGYKAERAELAELLTDDEYRAARASTMNAHYTAPIIIKAMYEVLANSGFATGNVLEPSCGTGNFFGLLPDEMSESKLFGVELDPLTARIASQLYQKVDIRAQGFEEAGFADDFFDVAIGNVPFGSYQVADKRYQGRDFLIHDYFFARTLDAVRPGGIVAFITSKGTLDKQNPSVRRYLAERAELLGAIRLPNTAFAANAGTKVTADIIFLQKRDRPIVTEPDWVHLGTDENGIALNSYFADNPDMVLGEMTTDGAMHYGRGNETTCKPYVDASLEELLRGAVANIHAEIANFEREEDELDDSIPADANVRNYSYALVDGKVYFRMDSRMYAPDLSKTGTSRVKGLLEIRDVLRELIEAQINDAPDAEVERAQAKLSFLYDNYAKKYGIINSRANSMAFAQDSSYALLCALENLDEEGNFVSKADMFTKRTIRATVRPDHADTPAEALAISLAEKASVDIGYMGELTGLDADAIATELQGVIFKVPSEDGQTAYQSADEYLSGNIREKLTRATEAAEADPIYSANVEALRQVLPDDLDAAEINVRLGATWIPTSDVEDFIYELLETPYYRQREIRVGYSNVTAQWNVSGKSRDMNNVRALSTYGTHKANAYKIIEDTLNLRDVRIFDYVEDADGKRIQVLNKKETAIALSKQDMIKTAFKDWVFSDPERRTRLVKDYNERFNSMRLRSFDGSHLSFPGMNPEIALRVHQSDAIARIMYAGNTLLAHVVGAGKTFEIVAAAQEMKRIGLCNKSMIVVPNHLTEQWAREYLTLYPSANILVSTKRDFERKNRRRFCARIATGEYDAVIIGHSQFEKIPMSEAYQKQMLQTQIEDVMEGIEELKSQRGERYSIKQMEAMKKRLEVRLKKLNDQSRKDDVITFEELGVDRLFIDEAHNFKNLFFSTKMRNVGGIPQTEAQKSSDLYMKCRYLDEKTGNKGVVFATGTPISNSMVELYTMQRYLQYDTLESLGLAHFDCWASTFGETVTAIELAPEGSGYRQKTRFAKFYNLPELMTVFRQVADIQTADMLDLPVPQIIYTNVSVAPSEFQKELVAELSERADKVRNRMVDATVDNMLKITNDGRKLALDQRLISDTLPDDEGSKVSACAANIYQIWEEHKEKSLAQLVFCDLSTPKNDGTFSVYNELRRKLIDVGIPENEIAFIHSADTESKKAELFGKVRSGQVRVLMGSTPKMGAGTNVQRLLIASHDLDCPWRPSDLEQRLGRIERQGNTNETVGVFRYVTENTFDAYLYQLVENKQRFISQIMTSKSPVRSAADVDETALSYAELKALATGNPLIKERMDLDVEVSRLKLLKANHLSQKYALEDKLASSYPSRIKALTERIEGYEKDVSRAQANPPFEKDLFEMEVVGTTYSEKMEAGEAILAAANKMTSPKPAPLGAYRGFALEVSFDIHTKCYQATLVGALRHTFDLGKDELGNITRIDNAIDRIEQDLGDTKRSLEETRQQTEQTKAEVEKPFAQENELKEKTERLSVLDRELDMGRPDDVVMDDDIAEPKTTKTEPALTR